MADPMTRYGSSVTKRQCAVLGCDHSFENIALLDGAEYVVCNFHYQSLNDGQPYEIGPNREILTGRHITPALVEARYGWRRGMEDGSLTLHFDIGYDGIAEQTVTFRMDREQRQALLALLDSHSDAD